MPLLTDADAAHLLRRVGVSGTDEEIAHFSGRDRVAVIDEMLAVDPVLPTRPGFAEDRDVYPGIIDFRQWWVNRMINARWVNRGAGTPSPLLERMTLFWHSHFATAASKVSDLRVMWAQNNIFRSRGMGQFHGLLNAVTTNGALLFHLDNQENTVWELQENFARELMELYTIGPEHFTENDVVEMARAWTGHGTVGWVGFWNQTYRYYSELHDHGQKTLFGQTAAWNGPDTLSLFTSGVRRQHTARFIAEKMWRFMVSDEPPAGVIDDVVAAWAPSLNIAELLRAILLHDEFWSSASRHALVRSPVEFAVDVLRRLGLEAGDTGLHWLMEDMGHELLEPPSVAGWGTGSHWLSTRSTWGKAKFVSQLRWDQRVWSRFHDAGNSETRENVTPRQAANRIIDVLGLSEPSPATRQALENYWSGYVDSDDRWACKYNAVIVGALTPEFQVA